MEVGFDLGDWFLEILVEFEKEKIIRLIWFGVVKIGDLLWSYEILVEFWVEKVFEGEFDLGFV